MLLEFTLLLVAFVAGTVLWKRSPPLQARIKAAHAFSGRLADSVRGESRRPRRLLRRASAATIRRSQLGPYGEGVVGSGVRVLLHPSDYALLEPLAQQHKAELEADLESRARGRKLRLIAEPRVELAEDPSAWRGWPAVRVEFLLDTLPARTRELAYDMLEPLTAGLPQFQLVRDQQLLGRSARRGHLVVPDARVSRIHCRLSPTNGGAWIVEDLESRNHTYVNGDRVRTATKLVDGETITLGTHVGFRLKLGPGQ